MNTDKVMTVLAHGLLGWALCAAAMGISLRALPLTDALLIHAIAAPIFFIFITRSYFQRYAYTTPLKTACIFIGLVISLDFFVVALLIQHSLAMFGSLLGTWTPFVLIFTATHMTGLIMTIQPRRMVPARVAVAEPITSKVPSHITPTAR